MFVAKFKDKKLGPTKNFLFNQLLKKSCFVRIFLIFYITNSFQEDTSLCFSSQNP